MFSWLASFIILTTSEAVPSAKDKPNIFFVLIDDLGWGNVGWQSTTTNKEVQTPHLDALAKNEGLILNRHYVAYVCTPTRSSFQSGRLPCHVAVESAAGNPRDGISQNMTCIGTKMKQAGFSTHIVGKWDVGMATYTHIPKGRGYDTSYIYLGSANDYYNETSGYNCNTEYHLPIVDFWKHNATYNGPNKEDLDTGYEEILFQKEIERLMDDEFKTDEPWFLVYTSHQVHAPQQIPKAYLTNYDNDEYNCSAKDTYVYPGFNNSNGNNVNYHCRSIYESMTTMLDGIIGGIVKKLKDNGMWNNTLMIVSSDNGGPCMLPCCSGSNHPLRGGKETVWEGGIRAAAFVTGGYLPENRRGKTLNGMMHIAGYMSLCCLRYILFSDFVLFVVYIDWYTTFCEMFGVDPFDQNAKEHGLPPVEGYNMWPMIVGLNETSPRTMYPIDTTALIQDPYKFIIGKPDQASWQGPVYPNASSPEHPMVGVHMDCTKGCLFDLEKDYTEHVDIAGGNPDIVKKMNDTLNDLIKGYYVNEDKLTQSCPKNITIPCMCWMAMNKYDTFMGPFCEVTV